MVSARSFLIRLGLFFLFLFSLGLAWPKESLAATLFFSPPTTTVAMGDSFSLTLKVSTEGVSVNAAEATVSYPANILKFESISQTDSIIQFWAVSPTGSDAAGNIHFSGGLAPPGYLGSDGTIIQITWRVVASGQAFINVVDGKVLAQDGQGSNVYSRTTDPFVVTATDSAQPGPELSSLSHPDQNSWSSAAPAMVTWTVPADSLGVSYSFDQQADTVPDETVELNLGQATYALPTDGAYYFHLRAKDSDGWGQTVHWRFQSDRIPPPPFSIELTRDRGMSDPSPTLVWSAVDGVSGIDHYSLVLDGQSPIRATSPNQLSITSTGSHRATVTAFDRAGNSRVSSLDFPFSSHPAPTFTSVPRRLILLQSLTLQGQAVAGDTITVFVDGHVVGQTMAGQVTSGNPGVTVRLPWTFRINQVLLPGNHRLTAVATSASGQASLATDPIPFSVSGRSLSVSGRPLATVAAGPAALAVAAGLGAAIVLTMGKLFWSVARLHRQNELAEEAISGLRFQLRTKGVQPAAIDENLGIIAADLGLRPIKPHRRAKKKTT